MAVNFREQLEQLRANALLQQQQQSQQTLDSAARQPIPGLTGPTTPMGGAVSPLPGSWGSAPSGSTSTRFGNMPANIGGMFSQLFGQSPPTVGMAPPNQPPIPGPQQQTFMASGPYGQQAAQMAGLLGGSPQQPVGGQQINALLGNKSRIPFYRPVGK